MMYDFGQDVIWLCAYVADISALSETLVNRYS